jgi:hypothetical protein
MRPFRIITDADMSELMDRLGSVPPRQACTIIGCGSTRLHELMRDGEVESYKDGTSRRITLRSIAARRERLLAEEQEARAPQPAADPQQPETAAAPSPAPLAAKPRHRASAGRQQRPGENAAT